MYPLVFHTERSPVVSFTNTVSVIYEGPDSNMNNHQKTEIYIYWLVWKMILTLDPTGRKTEESDTSFSNFIGQLGL